jgi:putative SOS response-associated peptidase YedK
MCGRYFRKSDKQKIGDTFKVTSDLSDLILADNYNIAPTTFQPVIRDSRDTGEREMVLMRWGLVPFFAKSLADFKGFSTFNARAESITTSSTWRGPMKSRRCLVPVDGFYEWKVLNDHKNPAKQPYAISLKTDEPMAFAGLWDAWKEPKAKTESIQTPDTWLQSFSIITTEANELMSQVHTRMPVILPERDWQRWLDREVTEQLPLDLLRPYDSEAMKLTPCNKAVGNVRNNGPEMLNSV